MLFSLMANGIIAPNFTNLPFFWLLGLKYWSLSMLLFTAKVRMTWSLLKFYESQTQNSKLRFNERFQTQMICMHPLSWKLVSTPWYRITVFANIDRFGKWQSKSKTIGLSFSKLAVFKSGHFSSKGKAIGLTFSKNWLFLNVTIVHQKKQRYISVT